MSSAEKNPFLQKLRQAWRRVLRDESFRGRVEFLKDIFLFEDLGAHAVALVASKVMEKSYHGGEVIFQEGDMGRACFVVAEGRVEVLRGEAGREQVLAVMDPGDFFGEMTLLDELPRSATARTVEPSRLYILYKTHLDALTEETPKVAAALLRNLARLLSARLRRQNLQAAVDSTLKDTAVLRVR